MNTKLNIKDSLLSESKVYKHFMVLLFMAFTVTTICKAQNTIIDDDGQAAIFFINDYPHASDVFWGNDDLAANGITHDNANWYITSMNRDYLGHSGAGSGWKLFKIPVNKDLNTANVGFPNGVILRFQSPNSPSHDLYKYRHMGDIDYISHDNKGYIIAPLYGSNTSYPVIGFFDASNLAYVNYARLPKSSGSGYISNVGWCAALKEGSSDYIITSPHSTSKLYKYKINWSKILGSTHSGLGTPQEIPLPYTINNMQGGEFSPNGEFLYLSSGIMDCYIPWFANTQSSLFDGIHLFKYNNNTLLQQTHSVNLKYVNANGACFDFSYKHDDCYDLEPEGLTFWDLSSGTAPGISGQLHVLLDDHDADFWGGPFAGGGKINLKHYKSYKAPNDKTVNCTGPNGISASNSQLSNIVNHNSTYANCASITDNAPSQFPCGETTVTFTVTDNELSATKVKSNVKVNVVNEHDECETALRIYACDAVVADNYCASKSLNLPPISGYSGDIEDVWFKFYPSKNFSVETYQINNGITNTVMQLFKGTCNNLIQLASDDTSGDGEHSKITISNYTGTNPLYLRITEYNANYYGNFGIYLKKIDPGSQLFTEASHSDGDGSGVNTYPTLSGDINGDGKTDLIFVGQNWNGNGLNIRTKVSNGDGSFTHHYQILGDGSGVHQHPTLTGDVNGDGKTDLIFIFQHWNGSGLTIRTKFSNGDGTYSNVTAALGDGSGVHEYPTLAGDINGDGKTDLVFIFNSTNDGLVVRTKMSNGDGTFVEYQDILGDGNGVHEYPTLIGDVNGDGKSDLIFIFNSNNDGLTIRTKMSNGDGTYTEYQNILHDGDGVHTYPTLAGDVNGDGMTDLIFVGQNWSGAGLNIRTKMSNGDGTFSEYYEVLGDGSMVHSYPTLIGDVDGDGKSDLIFVGQDWKGCGLNIRVKLSNGDGTWCSDFQTLGDGAGVHNRTTITGDANGDGKTDVLFVFQHWDGSGLHIRTKFSQIANCNPSISNESTQLSQYTIFPNPSNNSFSIATTHECTLNVRIFNSSGTPVLSFNRIESSYNFDVHNLTNGIYFIEITNADTEERVVNKFVKIE